MIRYFALLAIFFVHPLFALIDNISISGNPGAMNISTATAGSQPDSVTDTSTTYSIETGLLSNRITGQLDANMPANVTLTLQLQAPTGATSQGAVSLSTTPNNLVTNLPVLLLLTPNLQMTYTLSATVSATQAAAQNVTLTLTLL